VPCLYPFQLRSTVNAPFLFDQQQPGKAFTIGPNDTDVSTDSGRIWRGLKPGPTGAPDADRDWNVLSQPFIVGPKGRIGKLRPNVLKP
jgi:hypothetical protein